MSVDRDESIKKAFTKLKRRCKDNIKMDLADMVISSEACPYVTC